MSGIRAQQDLVAGLLFTAVAVLGLWLGHGYPLGTAIRMSSGYFPQILCSMLLAFGLFIAGRAFVAAGPRIGGISLRAVILIPLAVVIFALALRPFGLAVATVLATTIGALASPATKPRELLILAPILALLTVSVFVWGIGLLIPVWPSI